MEANSCFDARKKIGVTQEEFSRIFGVSTRTVIRWESSEIKPNSWANEIITRILQSDIDGNSIKQAIFSKGSIFALYKLLENIFKESEIIQ